MSPQYLNPVKLFIKARFRFLFKYYATGKHTEAENAKILAKTEAMPMLIHANSSIGMNLNSKSAFLNNAVV